MVGTEPVKGGTLTKLSPKAAELFRAYSPDSSARWALRFAQSLPQVDIVLSGINSLEQVTENMEDVEPLTEQERSIVQQAARIIEEETAVACTGCRYRIATCPKGIPIPDFFAMYNAYRRNPGEDWKIQPIYRRMAADHAKASDCIQCGQCESHCPQQLKIVSYLKEVANVFE